LNAPSHNNLLEDQQSADTSLAFRIPTRGQGGGNLSQHFEGPLLFKHSQHLALYGAFFLFICGRKLIQFFIPGNTKKTLLNLVFVP